MLDKNKVDPVLGQKVEAHLRKIGMHTPTVENGLTDDEKKAILEDRFTDIMQALGLDLSDDSLVDTPKRWAKMMVNELMSGLSPDMFPKCTAVDNKMNYDQMVCEKGITVLSQCEHHIVTIDGFATVAYIPKKKVLGLSKMNRIVEYFARRPQIQERLTVQIAEALKFILETDDVAVMLDCKHYCVKARGVEDNNSSTVTSHLSGAFRNEPEARAEFMSLARSQA
ncbi:homing endonuclease [Vibrio phage TCU-VP03-AIR1]|uniref:GTP cyclohydrolase I n=1 Tax=Vibrio phage phi-pp2 TaxID=1204514 RepID=I6XC45_9CAUD|nr:GTP cyclohydrolase I type 1 [Vibrio phage phi-pp2]